MGEVGFADMKREITPSLEGMPEIGWALMPVAQGKGIASEAVKNHIKLLVGQEDAKNPYSDQKLVEQLNEAIKATPKVEHKENVDVVKSHRAEIEKALQ